MDKVGNAPVKGAQDYIRVNKADDGGSGLLQTLEQIVDIDKGPAEAFLRVSGRRNKLHLGVYGCKQFNFLGVVESDDMNARVKPGLACGFLHGVFLAGGKRSG
ncbi:hypothetical protein SDC9_82493 [bioreactor metagenome]|uniref:Uncharacterized protein n=1 Tax=bioreactor metagenome TaxID=1076179 RepID=A0A644Z5N5_9ZZZZ